MDERHTGKINGGLRLGYPVSNNRYWRRYGSRTVLSNEGRAYKAHVKYQADKEQVMPSEGDIALLVVLHPKLTKKGVASKVAIDLDNCFKAVLDALQGVFYHDDNQVRFITAFYGKPIKGGGLTVKRMSRRVVDRLTAVLDEEAEDERNP